MRREIVITEKDFRQLRQHLLRPGIHEDEEMAYILCGVNRSRGYLSLLVRRIIPVPPEGFDHQSSVHLTVKKEFTRKVYIHCSESGLSLIEAHSHPFASSHVSFSGIDTANEAKRFPYVQTKIPKIHNATMVFGQDSIDAHMWDKKARSVVPIDLIRIVGVHSTEWVVPTNTAKSLLPMVSNLKTRERGMEPHLLPFIANSVSGERDAVLSRQILAFGRQGQEALSRCCVGVVGMGGIGSIVVVFLVRLGVRTIVLIDHDVVEWSNLNRMLGTTPASVGRPKVREIKRYLKRINPSVQVTAIGKSITNQKALSTLKRVDFLIGGVDNHGARLVLNQFSVKYLIPLIDCGTQIWVDEHGRIKGACGQVIVSIPGRFCLECIDRIDRQRAGQDLLPPHLREREIRAGYISGAEEPAPAVVSLNATAASLAVTELMNLVVGFKPIAHSIYYDVLRSKVEEIKCQAMGGCVVCGEAGVFGLGDLEPFPDFEQKQVPKSIPLLEETKHPPMLESEVRGDDNEDLETTEKLKS